MWKKKIHVELESLRHEFLLWVCVFFFKNYMRVGIGLRVGIKMSTVARTLTMVLVLISSSSIYFFLSFFSSHLLHGSSSSLFSSDLHSSSSSSSSSSFRSIELES